MSTSLANNGEILCWIGCYGNTVVNNGNPTWNGKPVPKDTWRRAYRMYLNKLIPCRFTYVDEWMYYQENKDN